MPVLFLIGFCRCLKLGGVNCNLACFCLLVSSSRVLLWPLSFTEISLAFFDCNFLSKSMEIYIDEQCFWWKI